MSEITITPLGTISPYTKGNMNCPGILINYNNKKILSGTIKFMEENNITINTIRLWQWNN